MTAVARHDGNGLPSDATEREGIQKTTSQHDHEDSINVNGNVSPTNPSIEKENIVPQHTDDLPDPRSVDANGNVYPEGGLRAWLVVYGSWSGMTSSFGLMNSIGAVQAYISQHQLAGVSPSTIGWIFSIYTFISFFCGVQIGPVFDAKGPRGLVLAGTVFLLAGVFAVAESTELWHFFLSFSVLAGLGTALIFTPAVASISHYFLRRRAAATGLATTGGSIGGIIFPLLLQKLFPVVGFAWSIRILGFVFMFQLLVANLLVRSRLPRVPLPSSSSAASSQAQAACTWPPVSSSPSSSSSTSSRSIRQATDCVVASPRANDTLHKSASLTSQIFASITSAVRAVFFLPPLRTLFFSSTFPNPFFLTTCATFFMEFALFIPISYLTSYALAESAHGISTSFAYSLIAVLNAGSFFGRWLPAGFLADRWGRYNMQIACTGVCVVSLLAIWLPVSLHAASIAPGALKASLIVFALLFGFGSGANISLVPVCVGQLCPTEVLGTWYAACYTVVSFGCALGLPVAGALLRVGSGAHAASSSGENWTALVLFAALSYALGMILFVCARARAVGFNWKKY